MVLTGLGGGRVRTHRQSMTHNNELIPVPSEHPVRLLISSGWQWLSTWPDSKASPATSMPGDDPRGALADRVAIVTGGARGIGKAISKRYASEGACVVIADIDSAREKRRQPKSGHRASNHTPSKPTSPKLTA
jgi:hypothetical protein